MCERGFDRELNSFVQAYGTRQLDASLLQIPLVGFLPPEDPRVVGTITAIEQRRVEAVPEAATPWGETVRPRAGAIGWHVIRIGGRKR